jgi:hypothetical protein
MSCVMKQVNIAAGSALDACTEHHLPKVWSIMSLVSEETMKFHLRLDVNEFGQTSMLLTC